jgi:tRNA (cmo5U34)-methyltransferase
MRHSVKVHGARIVAVDNAASMVERCRHYIALDDGQLPVALQCADIRDIDYQPASVVALNFTLQFLPPEDRDALLARLCQALTPGGALVLSEKVAFADAAEQSLLEELHLDFKRAQGYSEMEISRKRNALEEVLIPESIATHRQRLEAAGFEQVTLWHQSLNFVSILAIAPEATA